MNRVIRVPLIVMLGVLVATVAVLPPPLRAQTTPAPDSYLPGEVIAAIPGPGRSALVNVAADYGLGRKPLDEFGHSQIYRLRILDGSDPAAKALQLQRDQRVRFAEPNYLSAIPEDGRNKGWMTGMTSAQPPSDWALAAIHLNAAPGSGAGQVVAVLDTGVDTRHPALQGHLVPGYDFVDNDSRPDERGNERTNPGYGHGTHVAGIVAQVAPQARIMPVRVLDPNGFGNLWVLSEGAQFALDPNGDGDYSDGATILNLSLTVRRPTHLMQEIATMAAARGVIVVAAAGNDDDGDPNTPVPQVFPAAEPGVLGVTATDQQDRKAWFANPSRTDVDIAAPGVGITSLAPRNRYATWDGTSMAAPLVAGAAAAIWSAAPGLASGEIINRVRASVTPIDELNPAYAGQLGSGRLDFAPQASTPFVPLQLTSLCTVDPAAKLARWRVRNANPYAVDYAWQRYGSSDGGQRRVAANSDDIFDAPAGTLIITANGARSTKATNPARCAP